MDKQTKLAKLREDFAEISRIKQALQDIRLRYTFDITDIAENEEINNSLGNIPEHLSNVHALIGREIDRLESQQD